jgi:hypothetical protein
MAEKRLLTQWTRLNLVFLLASMSTPPNEEVVDWVALTVEARNATEQEHQLARLKAVKL